MQKPKWLIFYGDGSTFPPLEQRKSGLYVPTAEPEDVVLRENVQAIAMDDPVRAPDPYTVGRFVIDSWDFYIYSDHAEGWHGTNRTSDLIDHLKQGLGPGGVRAVLTGRWISNLAYKNIIARAKTIGDFHDKSSETKYPSTGVETD